VASLLVKVEPKVMPMPLLVPFFGVEWAASGSILKNPNLVACVSRDLAQKMYARVGYVECVAR
jgi:hypothetical protein